ncbi:hypothetical protein C0Q70_16940 [Pomacea canaliculata]|uniref:Uncharacterized protein n=1 Tax=Pomacea canaliculata TaxID=400727 RepID=A0A2T7NR71_POMCA|nr:hypothetical protein C0Q70_16940 [Pomacea canaliculata]
MDSRCSVVPRTLTGNALMLKQPASSDSSAAKQIDVFFPVSLTIEHIVSFGSKGSMVETWIIEDFPTPRSSKEEEFFSSLVTSKSDSGSQ